MVVRAELLLFIISKNTDNEQLDNGADVVLYGKLNCNVNCDCKTLVIITGLGLLFNESIACVEA